MWMMQYWPYPADVSVVQLIFNRQRNDGEKSESEKACTAEIQIYQDTL